MLGKQELFVVRRFPGIKRVPPGAPNKKRKRQSALPFLVAVVLSEQFEQFVSHLFRKSKPAPVSGAGFMCWFLFTERLRILRLVQLLFAFDVFRITFRATGAHLDEKQHNQDYYFLNP